MHWGHNVKMYPNMYCPYVSIFFLETLRLKSSSGMITQSASGVANKGV